MIDKNDSDCLMIQIKQIIEEIPGVHFVHTEKNHAIVFSTDAIDLFSGIYDSDGLMRWEIELKNYNSHSKSPLFTLYYRNCNPKLMEHLYVRFLTFGIHGRIWRIKKENTYVFSKNLFEPDTQDDIRSESLMNTINSNLHMIKMIDDFLEKIIEDPFFDVRIGFIDYVDNYWQDYHKVLDDLANGRKKSRNLEVDDCEMVKLYLYTVYDDRVYIGTDGLEHKFVLDQNLDGDGLSYSGDSITVSCRTYRDCQWLIGDANEQDPNFEMDIKDFIRDTYRIGGEMIFPRHKKGPSNQKRGSFNQKRGCDENIRDRFDLTLVAIKLFMEDPNDVKNPLYDVFRNEEEMKFFGMFKDFKEFCTFFFLEDMLECNEKGEVIGIKLFFEHYDSERNHLFEPNVATGEEWDPLPKNVGQYFELLKNQREFVEKRNARIKEYLDCKYLFTIYK